MNSIFDAQSILQSIDDGDMRKELIILTFLKYGDIEGRKRFQKLLYLAKFKKNIDIPFNFVNYLYGPYSREVQNTIDRLVLSGFMSQNTTILGSGIVSYSYSLTEKGRELLRHLTIGRDLESKIKNMIEEYKTKSTAEIVKEVYNLAGIDNRED